MITPRSQGHPDQFPYILLWQALVETPPSLKPFLNLGLGLGSSETSSTSSLVPKVPEREVRDQPRKEKAVEKKISLAL